MFVHKVIGMEICKCDFHFVYYRNFFFVILARVVVRFDTDNDDAFFKVPTLPLVLLFRFHYLLNSLLIYWSRLKNSFYVMDILSNQREIGLKFSREIDFSFGFVLVCHLYDVDEVCLIVKILSGI